MDLVAHCGESVAGEFLHTVNAVDPATGWREPLALPNRSQQAVREALERMRARLPFPLLRIDSDNDSMGLLRYCQEEGLLFTRSRPYRLIPVHVEQKSWVAVRQLIGYGRYESARPLALLEAIYSDWRRFVNLFQPVRKRLRKERLGSKVRKRYDQAKTPLPAGAGFT
ncbi:MAG: hypothetical protein QHH25_00150 [Candidatus Acetothermia bacterium]|jgi:hypothetical protein|nr:hypothetical protein [Candidatus Acetothermia bacterium]